MKIDLCKLFNVKEGEKFKIDGYAPIYFIQNGYLYFIDIDNIEKKNYFIINDFVGKNIIKLPKKKEFSQDTLNFFKCIDKKYKWIAKNKNERAWLFEEKPFKLHNIDKWDTNNRNVYICCNQSLFDQILWEDEEPICIDDYVER